MIDKPLAGRTIAVLLANGFEEEEFTEPQKRLIEAGATTKIVSRANGFNKRCQLPDRNDLDPADIPTYLPFVAIWDRPVAFNAVSGP